MSGQSVRIVTQLAGIIILGRLLTPSDYGLVAMVTAIMGVGEVFRDFGLSSAAIQAKTVTRAQKDNLFWINAGLGVILAIVAVGVSGGIADFYGDDRLTHVAQVLSITFVLNGLGTQFRASLTRDLQFQRLAVVDVAASLAALAAGVLMALHGFEYWSLVGLQICQALLATILLVVLGGWLPRGFHRRAPMRAFLNFGGALVGAQLLGYAGKNVDSIVIGATLGPEPLGLYSRAFQILHLPLSQSQAPSTRVALPVLSKLQGETARYNAFVLRGQTIMINVIALGLSFAAAQAESLFAIILGEQWLSAVPLFQILSLAGFGLVANYATYWVFLSTGHLRSHLLLSVWTRPLLIVAVLGGSYWGLFGIAIAYSVSTFLFWPITLMWLSRDTDAPALRMFRNGLRAFCVYGLAAVASNLIVQVAPIDAHVARIGVGLVGTAAAVGTFFIIWPAYRNDIRLIASTIRAFGSRA